MRKIIKCIVLCLANICVFLYPCTVWASTSNVVKENVSELVETSIQSTPTSIHLTEFADIKKPISGHPEGPQGYPKIIKQTPTEDTFDQQNQLSSRSQTVKTYPQLGEIKNQLFIVSGLMLIMIVLVLAIWSEDRKIPAN